MSLYQTYDSWERNTLREECRAAVPANYDVRPLTQPVELCCEQSAPHMHATGVASLFVPGDSS